MQICWIAISLAAACAVQAPPPKPEPEPEPKRPNVLLVTLDTTRADRLGCYGHAKAETPRLDSIAASGTRFDRAISTAGRTPIAHASIMTGLNPYQHDVRVFFGEAGHHLLSSVPTLAEILADHGYATAAELSSYPVSEAYGFQRGFGEFDCGVDLSKIDLSQTMEQDTVWVDAGANRVQRRSDATTDRALGWLEKQAAEKNWFLWVHYFDTHDFGLVPPVAFAKAHHIDYADAPQIKPAAARRDWIYDLELAYVDSQFGRLLDAIAARGETEETLIVVLADHGQGLLDGEKRHGWSQHGILYDWCIRVPLLIRLPAKSAQTPHVVPQLVRNIDVFPTILEALGLAAPAPIEGQSLLPLVMGKNDESEPRTAYAEALCLIDVHGGAVPERSHDNLFMTMNERWKLIWHATKPAESELFDLATDPLELKNVAEANPAIVEQLRASLEARGAFTIRKPGEAEQDPKAKALLNALGYGKDGKKKDDE